MEGHRCLLWKEKLLFIRHRANSHCIYHPGTKALRPATVSYPAWGQRRTALSACLEHAARMWLWTHRAILGLNQGPSELCGEAADTTTRLQAQANRRWLQQAPISLLSDTIPVW